MFSLVALKSRTSRVDGTGTTGRTVLLPDCKVLLLPVGCFDRRGKTGHLRMCNNFPPPTRGLRRPVCWGRSLRLSWAFDAKVSIQPCISGLLTGAGVQLIFTMELPYPNTTMRRVVLLRSNFSDPSTGRSIFFLCQFDLQGQASIAVSWSEDITSSA